MSFTILLSFSNIDNNNKKLIQYSNICTSVQQCRYQFGLLSSFPRLNSGPINFSFKTLPRGKILLTKSLAQGRKFDAKFVAFDKICGQMLNNFTAFSTVFHNFHAALFSLIKVPMKRNFGLSFYCLT